MQVFLFFSMCACQKGSRSQSFLAETVKTGHKNCGVTGAIHVLWRKLFQNRLVHEFGCLKELITLEKRNTVPQWPKKKKNLKEQNFDGETNWLGVVSCHRILMSLVMSMWFIFRNDWNDVPCSSCFCSLVFTTSFDSLTIHVYLYLKLASAQVIVSCIPCEFFEEYIIPQPQKKWMCVNFISWCFKHKPSTL